MFYYRPCFVNSVRFSPKNELYATYGSLPENTLERLQQRQQILTPPVTQTLKNLDSEMSHILSSKQLDDEA